MATALALAAAAGPGNASAGLLTPPGGGCPAYDLGRPFLPWLDVAQYALVPNGGLESGSDGWILTGGAHVAAGNERFYVRAASDASSLVLPAGSSATTGAMCVGALDPTLRFFARNSGSLLSTLKVEVLYEDAGGQLRSLAIGSFLGRSSWHPTLPIAFLANLQSLPLITDGATSVAFRFTPRGSLGSWRVDDVYVDPFKGR